MNTTQINNIKIKPVIKVKKEPEKIGGYNLFPELYSNIFICAKKCSGKTTLLFNILQKCVNKKTHCWIFGSTINKDDTYKEIFNMLEKKGCHVNKFLHFIDDDKSNIIEEIITELKGDVDEEEEQEEKKPESKTVICKFHNDIEDNTQKKKKEYIPKRLYPEHVFICDDLGSDMRNTAISQLLKTNRHFKSKVILIGHTLNDLYPASRKQLDYVLLFKCLSDQKLETLYNDLDLSIEYEDFKKAYDYATTDKFNFLYISTRDDNLRKNFNESININ
jgi:hypothetical protein